ncbi:MAG TPA: phosphoesterase [Spirochaetia bacterium]|nr:phosphoesterase [Spirochaetia bacterium]
MAANGSDGAFDCQDIIKGFDALFTDDNHLLIVIHNNPDPDAIAAASALKFLVEQRYRAEASITYGGGIGRAENRVMAKKLKIKMKQLARIKISKYDRIAFIDTQPGAANHSLPPGRDVHIIIDHHPRRRDTRANVVVIRPEIGATASILTQILRSCGLELTSVLATALSYAISSETQNMKREASRVDLDAYLWVYMKSNMRALGEIIHPKLHHSHFETLLKALHNALLFRNLICLHLGEIPQPEIVSEMADYFLRRERIGAVFATGRFKDSLIVSLRSANAKYNAGKLIKRIVNNTITVGGHDQVAGGFVPIIKMRKEEVAQLEEKLSASFARSMGYETFEWKKMMEEKKDDGGGKTVEQKNEQKKSTPPAGPPAAGPAGTSR